MNTLHITKRRGYANRKSAVMSPNGGAFANRAEQLLELAALVESGHESLRSALASAASIGVYEERSRVIKVVPPALMDDIIAVPVHRVLGFDK